jgi:glycosyltransferase involved in cell wall biosynthesis
LLPRGNDRLSIPQAVIFGLLAIARKWPSIRLTLNGSLAKVYHLSNGISMAKHVLLGWQISTVHGWGVVGLNLALNWASDQQIESAATAFDLALIDVDPIQKCALAPFIKRSQEVQKVLQSHANGQMMYNGTFLASLGNDFRMGASAHNVTITSNSMIGVIAFELSLSAEGLERAKHFSRIVTHSSWNERVLRAYGIENVLTVPQGIDPAYFCPGPKHGFFRDRFLIFSGGKAEYRKAQDIVLAAFKVFSERHPEAVLVTAWHNFWPETIQSLDWSGLLSPVVFNEKKQFNVPGWAIANGVRADRLIDLGIVPNLKMPMVLREMDVALFPNRCEGATNMVAMECMACALPVILSRNTGHVDLIEKIEKNSCYTLDDQRQTARGFPGIGGVSGWGESQIHEVVERLEQVFSDRAEAKRRGRRAAERLAQLTWQATAEQLKEIVMASS